MNFDLSDEQRAIRDSFARFVDERVLPKAAAIDEAREFPRALFGELAALGLFGLRYPEEAGGSGLGLTEFCLALAEIARGSMSLAGAAAMQSLMGTKFLHMLGNADIVERLFAPVLRGEKIGAVCLTEPDAGSDLGAIPTRPPLRAGRFRLSVPPAGRRRPRRPATASGPPRGARGHPAARSGRLPDRLWPPASR